jgi:LEA14-like dessication related protein
MLPWEGPPLPKYADISIRLKVENPTDVDITISRIEYQVEINGNYAGHGSIHGIHTVPPKDDYQIDSIFRADFNTAGQIVITAIASGRFNIEIIGTAHLEGNSQAKDVTFSSVIQLP